MKLLQCYCVMYCYKVPREKLQFPMCKQLIIILLLLSPIFGFSFTFTVTPTSENCSGNGTLSFTASDTDSNGSIVYEVYLLPDTSVPLATVTGNSLGGLSAGNYRIIAKETVGTVVTTQQQEVTISFAVVPLTFTIQTFNQACSANSNITVNTTSGVGVSYEIFSGPITFPLQSSNTFSGLPVGVYRVRVFDACGSGVVSTFTVTLNPTGLNVDAPTFANASPPSCNLTVVQNNITPATGTVIGYPLNIQYIVHPPSGGADQNFNLTVPSGDLLTLDISQQIPYFLNQNYDYDLIITDACGSVFNNNFPVNQNITLEATRTRVVCLGYFFEVTTTNFTPPFNLTFNASPVGFNPVNFNVNYPGPFTSDAVVFGGSTNPVPDGTYQVTITDSCGRANTSTFTITPVVALPLTLGTNNGCATNSGNIVISIPEFRLVSATLLTAPTDYPIPLPQDVSSLIDAAGVLTLNPVPLGDYTFLLTNECGSTFSSVMVTVPAYINQGLYHEVRPGCDLGESSIIISSFNTALSSVNIIAAPTSFVPSLPTDVSSNIAFGFFVMNSLPAGTYTFEAVDTCNFTNTLTVTLDGYAITDPSFSMQENCGSFDIALNYISNANANETFWLQKLVNATNGTWGHPATGVTYNSGTLPNESNSYLLANNTTTFNLIFSGTFRIVRSFSVFNNGAELNAGTVSSFDRNCITELSPTFSFYQVLEIVDAYRMPCSSTGSLDVVLSVNGPSTIQYSIIEKDGLPFNLNNGNSNIFTNLGPGIYTFQVQDNCGNIVNRIFDVNNLLSLITITEAGDILSCKDVITNTETFDISTQGPLILGTQPESLYTISYHESLADAQNNSSPILNLTAYNPTSNPQTVFVRVVYSLLPNCYEITSFDINVGQNPSLLLDSSYLGCLSSPILLSASSGNLSTTTYLWSDGTTAPTYTVSDVGTTTVSVTATNSYGTSGQNCPTQKQIEVIISEPPVIDRFETSDWTVDENSITVITSNSGAFEYSLDNITFQDSSTFTNLKPGVYTVYVQDKFGCGFVQKEIWLLYYPYFFTPNNDSYNDTWFIANSENEPDLKVYVYDRYGKLIKYLDGREKSWDGTYNSNQAVSTDYWFLVTRQDGRSHRGHFTLKR